MPQKNDVIETAITAMSHEGSGIARHEGVAIFVPMTAIGDRVKVRIVKVLSSYAYGIVLEMLEPSTQRVESDCPVYKRCGGCSLRHIDYGHEMQVKAGWVEENMARIGGIRIPVDPPVSSPSWERYRNKALYPIRRVGGKLEAGFFSRRTHNLVPVKDCLLQPAFFTDITRIVLDYMERYDVKPYDEDTHTGLIRHLYIRWAERTGQVMVCLVINGRRIPQEEKLLQSLQEPGSGVVTVVLSHNTRRTNVIMSPDLTVLTGPGYIEDVLCGIGVRLSPLSFYQVNREGAELLYKAALEYADPEPGDTLLDLYCGAGTIGLSMAHRAGEIIGVEVVPAAIKDAEENAARAGIKNARFLCGDAAQAAQQLEAEGIRPDIVILDPPRKGIDDSLLQTVVRMAPDKVVYVSCNSATLSRDCKELATLGYRLARLRAVDMFPRTAHVEAVALLEKTGEV